MLGQALELIYFPARLLLRKLGGEGSDYFAGQGNLTALSQTEESSPKYKENCRLQAVDPCTYSMSERRVSRFSLSEPCSSAKPVCTKHPRQSPL